jgi:hypothetical protein
MFVVVEKGTRTYSRSRKSEGIEAALLGRRGFLPMSDPDIPGISPILYETTENDPGTDLR